MTDTVRAFLAVELSGEVKAALRIAAETLRAARIRGLRCVDPDGIHLTIRFLGAVPVGQTESIVARIAPIAARHKAFGVELGSAGAFPNNAPPRVLWIGVGGDLSNLAALYWTVATGIEALGFPSDRRGFSPHLTVGRLGREVARPKRKRAIDLLASAPRAPVPIDVRAVSLMRSILGPGGARYERLALMPLATDGPDRG